MRAAITSLQLTDYRNHLALTLAPGSQCVCLIGANGSGKTNVLEAVSQLSPGRGLRAAALADIAAIHGAGAWTVSARLQLDGRERRLGVGLERAEAGFKRTTRIDGADAAPGALANLVRMSWLTPAMDRLFSESPGERRRFLDRLVFAHEPDHGAHASALEKALTERGRLLADEVRDSAWYGAIEARLAEHGAHVACARARLVRSLNAAMSSPDLAGFPRPLLRLQGLLEEAASEGADERALRDLYAQTLERTRGRDQAAGRTLQGPHRADLLAHHREKDIPAERGSTGEQKALLVSMVLAHARLLAASPAAFAPILLLDEVAAHLDNDRRHGLARALLDLGVQCWLTGTDAQLFEGFGQEAFRLEF